MKKLFIVLGFLILSSSAFGQAKPLTQSEFVKLLYAVEKDTSAKTDLIEAVRTRGIGFTLSDGLRSLTRTKSKNDEEVRRVVEEAERRRKDPSSTILPDENEANSILQKVRTNTQAAIEEMPDFVVKQLVARSIARAGTGNWRGIDNVAIAVSYSDTKGEQYKVLTINGAPVNAETRSNYNELSGSTTSGEFVMAQKKLFDSEYKTEFKIISTDILNGRKTFVYEFTILIENNKGGGVSYEKYTKTSVPAGEKGKVWIDPEQNRVVKIEYDLTDLPPGFPVTAFGQSIEYGWVTIADQPYLLPILSESRFTARENIGLIQTRNVIRFRSYQKYGTEVKVVEEEDVPVEEVKKPDQ